MADSRRFVQFPHPGREHDPGNARSWNTYDCDHARKFMELPGEWVDEGGRANRATLWAWGEWEAEADLLRGLDQQGEPGRYPRYLWAPFYSLKDEYQDLHNTDPFTFGERFLYSNCRQPRGSRRSGLMRLGRGSILVFGSAVGHEWVLDTVIVVEDAFNYVPASMRDDIGHVVSDEFMDVTGEPIIRNERDDLPLRLYRGATPTKPVEGMFSFFPAMPAAGSTGFPRPAIDLPARYFNPASGRAPKGHALGRGSLSFDELRELWHSLVRQVHNAGLVLGTHAELPERREG